MERFRKTLVVIWFSSVAVGIAIFGHGIVWPCIFVGVAYCVIDALVGVAKNRLSGHAHNSTHDTQQDKQGNQLDPR